MSMDLYYEQKLESIGITSLEVDTTKYTDDLDKANIVNN